MLKFMKLKSIQMNKINFYFCPKPALLQKARVTRKHKELNIQLEKRPGGFSLFENSVKRFLLLVTNEILSDATDKIYIPQYFYYI